MTRTLGTCSLCGGAVTCPVIWHGVYPPTPTCSSCGATAAAHGPVIPMRPAQPSHGTNRCTVPPLPYVPDGVAFRPTPYSVLSTGEPS